MKLLQKMKVSQGLAQGWNYSSPQKSSCNSQQLILASTFFITGHWGHSELTSISQLSKGELLFLLTHTLVENINMCVFVNIPVLYPEFYRKTHKEICNSTTAVKYD